MFNRTPDVGTVTIKTETPNGTPFPDIAEQTVTIKGRYEVSNGNKNLDYTGKFYCQRLEILEGDPKILDGQKMQLEGSFIGIARARNYQTHCEIWLD